MCTIEHERKTKRIIVLVSENPPTSIDPGLGVKHPFFYLRVSPGRPRGSTVSLNDPLHLGTKCQMVEEGVELFLCLVRLEILVSCVFLPDVRLLLRPFSSGVLSTSQIVLVRRVPVHTRHTVSETVNGKPL